MHVKRASLLAGFCRRLEHRRELDDVDRAAIVALPYVTKTLEPGAYFVREGDRITSCCVLIEGFAFRSKIIENGARQIVSIHLPDEALDLQNCMLAVADHNIQTLSRATLAIIPRDAIFDLIDRHPAVGLAMWEITLIEASIFREWIANIGRRPALGRIAHLLCEFALRAHAINPSGPTSCKLPMTQEQIADAVGLTPVHVNRMLKELSASGLVTMRKGSVFISDVDRLRASIEFSATYLHSAPYCG